jgi:hypothetical protein
MLRMVRFAQCVLALLRAPFALLRAGSVLGELLWRLMYGLKPVPTKCKSAGAKAPIFCDLFRGCIHDFVTNRGLPTVRAALLCRERFAAVRCEQTWEDYGVHDLVGR